MGAERAVRLGPGVREEEGSVLLLRLLPGETELPEEPAPEGDAVQRADQLPSCSTSIRPFLWAESLDSRRGLLGYSSSGVTPVPAFPAGPGIPLGTRMPRWGHRRQRGSGLLSGVSSAQSRAHHLECGFPLRKTHLKRYFFPLLEDLLAKLAIY